MRGGIARGEQVLMLVFEGGEGPLEFFLLGGEVGEGEGTRRG